MWHGHTVQYALMCRDMWQSMQWDNIHDAELHYQHTVLLVGVVRMGSMRGLWSWKSDAITCVHGHLWKYMHRI